MKTKHEKPDRHPQPFPWLCSTCGKDEVRQATIRHTATVKHHGRKHTVEVHDLPVLQCGSCKAILMVNESHDKILHELRRQEGLLQPEEIRKGRMDRGLKQRELAQEIQAAATTICKWESGMIVQSRRADRAIRDFFARTPAIGDASCSTACQNTDELLRSIFDSCTEEFYAKLPTTMMDHQDVAKVLEERRDELCHLIAAVLKDCVCSPPRHSTEGFRDALWLWQDTMFGRIDLPADSVRSYSKQIAERASGHLVKEYQHCDRGMFSEYQNTLPQKALNRISRMFPEWSPELNDACPHQMTLCKG